MTDTAIPQLQRVSASGGAAAALGALRRDGGVIVEGMFPLTSIDEIRTVADSQAERSVAGSATQGLGEDGKDFVGANTIRFSGLARLTPAFFDLLDNKLFAAMADDVLLPSCGSYWMNTAQVMYIGPGEPAQVLHRDADNWWEFVKATWPNSPEITLSAMIGLDQVTEELGATRVIPGSQHDRELEQRLGQDSGHRSVPAELGPGDALVYSGYVFHGGGANRTADCWRKAMHLSFVAGWLRPEEAAAFDFNLGELAGRSERVQQMLGHRSYDPRPHRGGGLWLRDVREIG